MKKRSIVWLLIQLMPFVFLGIYALQTFGQSNAIGVDEFMVKIYDNYFRYFAGTFLYDIFCTLILYINGIPNGVLPIVYQPVAAIVSYEVVVLLLRIGYEVIVFLPKFCISVFERKKGE